jgi:single-strand DNA-binding protein
MTLNDCKLAGYLGAKPELRYLPSGTPVVNMRIGQSYNYTDQHKKDARKTNWFAVVAYGPVAEIARHYEQGDNIVLDGQLETREWTATDNSKRRVVEIVARNIGKLEKLPSAGLIPAEAREGEDDDWPVI